MNENEHEAMIPFYVHQAEMARERKHSRMLFILCLVVFLTLVATNGAWIYYDNQYSDSVVTEQTVTQDNSNGTNNFVGGDIVNGETDSNN